MWPFKRNRRRQHDLLLEDVDLSTFAPFAEAERYTLVFPVGVGFNYVLVLVYQATTGERVHVAHSPGYQRGGGMENFIGWIATGVRRRDPRAIALLTSWPPDLNGSYLNNDELMRSHFAVCRGGVASPSTTYLVDDDGGLRNAFTRNQECLYASPSFYPRLSAGEWSRIFGTEVRRFSTAEWEAAADEIDPDRSLRNTADEATSERFADLEAFMKEHGVY